MWIVGTPPESETEGEFGSIGIYHGTRDLLAMSRTPLFAAVVLAMAPVVIAGCTKRMEPSYLFVTVKSDGQTCVVKGGEVPCASLALVLTNELGQSKSAELAVSPEGCGESAMTRAKSVAGQLNRSGFTRVAVVGFLSQPNTVCDP